MPKKPTKAQERFVATDDDIEITQPKTDGEQAEADNALTEEQPQVS